jgi:hypothetical protein
MVVKPVTSVLLVLLFQAILEAIDFEFLQR